jgi:hypothetical protein
MIKTLCFNQRKFRTKGTYRFPKITEGSGFRMPLNRLFVNEAYKIHHFIVYRDREIINASQL